MSGIVFFKTRNLPLMREFYHHKLGMKLWLDQRKCLIFSYREMLIGFCQQKQQSLQNHHFALQFSARVNHVYERQRDIATTEPKLNSAFKIYHFWAKDPEGRDLEFQYFLRPKERKSRIIELLKS
jgi:catechol-2,3-dioxygenase